MKYLLIGDMHGKPDNIEESRRIIEWCAKICKDRQLTPIFMGDQYDTKGVARVALIDFWVWAFDQFSSMPIALDGNHDMDAESVRSLMIAHRDRVFWVNDTVFIPEGDVGLMPFRRSNDRFITEANKLIADGAKIILCHQEFNGAQYDNGFYSPGGVDLDKVPGVFFIAGHIHTQQKLGDRCFYIGTPRQLTVADAGKIKGVWVFDSLSLSMEFIATPEDVAEPYRVYEITPESEKVKVPDSVRSIVNVRGPKEFCQKAISKLPASSRIFQFRENDAIMEIRESDGVNVAFSKFIASYLAERALTQQTATLLATKIYDKCPTLK